MEETSKLILDKVTEHFEQPKLVGPGVMCTTYYECSRLSPSDLARLAAEAIGHLSDETFEVAVGIAYTGIFFASAVAAGRQVAILQADGVVYGPSIKGKKIVLVDDVVYKGRRMKEASQKLEALGAELVGCVCIVDRAAPESVCPQPLWSALQLK